MKFAVIAVGRLKRGPERDLVTRYRERVEAIGRPLGIGLDLVELDESRARRAEDRRRDEAALIRTRIGAASSVVFDERGASLSSEAFATKLGAWRDQGRSAAFVIGGADGLDSPLREEAALTLSFGALTLPHQIVRVLVLEQLYRALTIITGHPYHRGEG